jgi:two-component system, OmpR family, sensor histidine kinase VicK
MNLRQKFILLLLIIGLIPTIVVSIIAYFTTSTQLTNKTLDQLQSIAVKQHQQVTAIFQEKQEELNELTERDDFLLAVNDYLSGKTKNTTAMQTILAQVHGVEAIYLSTPDDVVIASTSAGYQGDKLSLKEGFENPAIVDGSNKLYIAIPFLVNKKNTLLLTGRFSTDDFVAAIKDYTGLGNTGETIIVRRDANHKKPVPLFPLRFDAHAALKTDMSSLQLFEHPNATYKDVTDYRNKSVMVSSRTIGPEWIIATKIDTEEAFAPIVQLRNALILMSVASSITIIIFAFFLARFFTAPILSLTEKARRIMQGDFSETVTEGSASSDEVGTLTTLFNQMVSNVKQKIEQLHDEQVKLQASINSLSVGFIMVDRDNNIITINHTARQALCASSSSPLATIKECTLTHIEDELQGIIDLKGLINRCFVQKKTLMIREVEFQNRFLKIFITPIITIGVIGAVILIEDITEAKILERSKDEFFSIASHELRTPLTAIRGNTAMIKDFYASKIADAEFGDMLKDIHESSIRLIEIVNDFLDMSRLEQGRMEFKREPVDLGGLIKSIIKEYQVTGSQKQVLLEFKPHTDPLPAVFVDIDKTKQVFINLIGNAMKFTEKGSVTISTAKEGGFIKIFVTDTGRGIAPVNQNFLFRKFQQANNSILTRDTTKGTGLGLYISKLIIEGLKGVIRLERSILGQGTTFAFTLPIATQEQLHPTAPQTKTNVDLETGLRS